MHGLYDAWLRELIDAPPPESARTTCDTCSMVATTNAEALREPERGFHPDTKCCTYKPELASYLVGGILTATDEVMRPSQELLRRQIARGANVTPFGVQPNPIFDVIYPYLRDTLGGFGKVRNVRCDFYVEEGGLCGIWRFRNAVCTTYFCKPCRGKWGQRFWIAARKVLRMAEIALRYYCVDELELPSTAIEETLGYLEGTHNLKAVNNIVPPEVRASMWGDWNGREDEYFVACYELCKDLTWGQISELAGPELRVTAKQVKAAYADLEAPPHQGLVQIARSVTTLAVRDGSARMIGYNRMDPVDMPVAVLERLSTAGVIDGAELDRAADYVDHGVLIPAETSSLDPAGGT